MAYRKRGNKRKASGSRSRKVQRSYTIAQGGIRL